MYNYLCRHKNIWILPVDHIQEIKQDASDAMVPVGCNPRHPFAPRPPGGPKPCRSAYRARTLAVSVLRT